MNKEKEYKRGIKIPLPFRRKGYVRKVKIGGHSVFLQTGEYEDGSLGEIWVETQNSDSPTIKSLVNCFAVAISMGLQRGIPLEDFINQFVFYKFEPSGIVENHEELKIVTSIVDFIFRELGSHYLNRKDLVQIKGGSVEKSGRG